MFHTGSSLSLYIYIPLEEQQIHNRTGAHLLLRPILGPPLDIQY